MNLTRRGFFAGGAAFAAAQVLGARAANLRVGILSDVHVTKPENANWFEKALRHFDSVKVDAVMITGDIAHTGLIKEFERFAAVWDKVFPGDRAADGRAVHA